jgi:hypothetical protein
MAAEIFDKILAKGIRSGQVPARTEAAREWYRNAAKRTVRDGGFDTEKLQKESASRAVNKITLGNMYMFTYNAKHAKTLPYFDRYPLIFPIGLAKGGFMGINMHYLPPQLRAKLMDALYTVINNDKYDETTRVKLTYNILNGATKFNMFKPTIKHYLSSQIKSRFIYISPAEWDIALFLPMADFGGVTKQKVYADSRKIIRGQ